MVDIRLTTAAMRSIDKAGGFDSYIYYTPQKKLQSMLGMALKQRMRDVVQKFNLTPRLKISCFNLLIIIISVLVYYYTIIILSVNIQVIFKDLWWWKLE